MCLLRTTFLILFSAAAAAIGLEFRRHIHSHRWDVKTLADGFIADSTPVPTTIDGQISLPEPTGIRQPTPRLPSEQTVYVLTGQIIHVKEDLDNDYKFIFEDPKSHNHMIAEIPDPNGDDAPNRYKPAYRRARHVIDSLTGAEPDYAGKKFTTPPIVRITGVGLFDQPHPLPLAGTAPNNREIHPVLKIEVLR
ncbi:MAG TPA: hypothetical protein VG537_05110 [Candidatus Kapabacteria bacterium]|jgi:hypothetical protein|nr:hypothetical protein [Candidatus Kapabacteria bacterium]